MTRSTSSILLLILDGWGQAPAGPGNAVSLACTPNLDQLLVRYPHTLLSCSGRAVGLPDGFMGNSEVGHINIGAGRVVYQDMARINMAIDDGSFNVNPVLMDLMARVRATNGRLHLLGLVSDGGVHSHLGHLVALLALAKAQGIPVVVHAFLDGRDTPPTSGLGYLRQLQTVMERLETGRIATIIGRYWAMDRDKHWDRNALAYAALVQGEGVLATDPLVAVEAAYSDQEFDEFIKPRVIVDHDRRPLATIDDDDVVFCFNFRADRVRQLIRSLFDPAFDDFVRRRIPRLAGLATMTEYDAKFILPSAFPSIVVSQVFGEVLADRGFTQLRIAETEKYAHVTYFFNVGREEPFPGEDRILIPSPHEVVTYDYKPQMSCPEVTDRCIVAWKSGVYDMVICNLANLDMVGHTGIIPAVMVACETVDACVGRIMDTALALGGRVFIAADHGNAEEMIDLNGQIQTAHSKNPVALVYIEPVGFGPRRMFREGGVLGDIAPTILDAWGLPQPEAMTGKSLFTSPAGGR
ncbi:2,3-bisphosphoglycerate-independent phosphoglycerate mutase [Desulfovibrionales bacterium]